MASKKTKPAKTATTKTRAARTGKAKRRAPQNTRPTKPKSAAAANHHEQVDSPAEPAVLPTPIATFVF
jgi:hypothetical protein